MRREVRPTRAEPARGAKPISCRKRNGRVGLELMFSINIK